MPVSRSATRARSRRLVRLRTTAPRRPWTRRNRPAAGDPHACRSRWRGPRAAWSRLGNPRGAHRRREVRPLAQSVRRRQHRRPSGGELGAALTATSGEDAATRAGAHPQTEAVGLGPAAVVRLESPLAHDVLSSALVGLVGPGGRGAGGHRLPSETHDLRGEAAPFRVRVTGMRKQPNHRPVNGTRERPRGSNQRDAVPGLEENALGSHGARPATRRDTPSVTTRHTHNLWTTMWTGHGSRRPGTDDRPGGHRKGWGREWRTRR